MSKKMIEKNLRASNLLFGLVIIIMAIIVILFSVAGVIFLLLITSIGVIIIGVARLINGYANEKLDSSAKIVKILSGLLAILFGIIVLINTLTKPLLAIDILILLIAILFLLIGVARVFVGALTKEYYTWYRIILMFIGIVVIILSVIVLFNLKMSDNTLIFILALSMLLTGIARLILGIIGIQ